MAVKLGKDPRGVRALFIGGSSTGKTMAACVIASELHLHLYRIDLSSVVNKYIGETEKNLRRLFDAADDCNVALLFDEADALFSAGVQRSALVTTVPSKVNHETRCIFT